MVWGRPIDPKVRPWVGITEDLQPLKRDVELAVDGNVRAGEINVEPARSARQRVPRGYASEPCDQHVHPYGEQNRPGQVYPGAGNVGRGVDAEAIEGGDAEIVIFETVFTLQRQYGHPKAAIRDSLLPLLELPGIVLPGKRRFRTVFDLYVDLNLSFVDAYHAVLMRQLGLNEIVTFDKQLDRVPSVKRLEPNGG